MGNELMVTFVRLIIIRLVVSFSLCMCGCLCVSPVPKSHNWSLCLQTTIFQINFRLFFLLLLSAVGENFSMAQNVWKRFSVSFLRFACPFFGFVGGQQKWIKVSTRLSLTALTMHRIANRKIVFIYRLIHFSVFNTPSSEPAKKHTQSQW